MKKLTVIFACLSILRAPGQAIDSIDLALKETGDGLTNISYPSNQETFPAIYNGRQFYGYSAIIKGHAFYLSRDWSTGTILYDGVWYRNAELLYDTYRDEILVEHPDGLPVILFRERVKQFTLQGQTFVYLKQQERNEPASGFYEVVERGRAVVYAKRVKQLIERIEGMALEREFMPADAFFILKGNRYYRVFNERSLLNVLKDKKQQIQRYRRHARIKYKKNPELFILKTTGYYNQLTH